MAIAGGQHCHGTPDLCSPSFRCQRLPRLNRLVSPGGGKCLRSVRPQAGFKELACAFFCLKPPSWTAELRDGRFQKHLAFATILSAFFSGFEALYSHYKNNFKYKAQWSPVIIAPALMTAAAVSIKSPKAARTWLPVMSVLAILDGGVGFFYHARGVLRRPGGLKKPIYNVVYGPPIFAPLLFAACGVIGLLACLMRRERR